MDAPIDLPAETYRVGELILKCLSDLGHVWEARDGTLVEVRFAGARVVAGQYALFEVDTLRLPRKVTAADLTHPRLIHHLATVGGRPVSVLNTRGITYIVNLAPAAPKPVPRLPRYVPLTWERLLAWSEQENLPEAKLIIFHHFYYFLQGGSVISHSQYALKGQKLHSD